mmetsp:Transcript_1355/g.3477  ORF Transcript_1355/g.3477 Transcript_1355/m.3477 type:complete len:207 (-) Transcript_1355:388-1008(-)
MVVGVREELTGLLRCGVWTDWVVNVFFLREESRFRSTIDRGRRCKYKVLHTIFVGKFHELGGAFDVGVDVNERILNRRSNTCTGCHVAHPFGLLRFKDSLHQILVANVTTVDFDSPLLRIRLLQESEVGFLDAHIVIIVDFVNDNDIITSGKKELGNITSNESCTTGDKNLLVTDVRLHRGVLGHLRRIFDLGKHHGTSRPVHICT